jgi:hypothetical protein
MKKTLVKYLAGWLTSEKMKNEPLWLALWTAKVEKEENEGNTVIVLSLPKNANIEDLEQHLQSIYG